MIVDDEEMVVRSIANLLEMETDYRLLPYNSPHEALETARRERIDCVVTDFLMPEMDGLAFLRALAKVSPGIPAILLTGYADKESAIKAINDVQLFQYLEKPWDNDHLRLVIRNAVNHRSLEESLRERLHELDRARADRDSFRQTAEELEAELALAEEVQRSILPRGPLQDPDFRFFHRYYPTGRLGGDFFDVTFLGPGRFNAIVADVAGHGVAAALGTMLVKVIFTDASRRGDCCNGMMEEMNARLEQLLYGQQYVTAFALSVNGPEKTVTAAPAGGPHPILFSREPDAPVEEWPLNGLPLGAFESEIFRHPEIQTRPFAPGQRILLYTDGLLDTDVASGESADPKEIVRTVERLRHLDGDELLDRLAESRGIGGRVLPDDVNTLLIEYC
jgi:serine phosphatase RsbU (regulator of sigma subunit)